jgi:hypothetical protein
MYGDLSCWPDMAAVVNVDASVMSIELPTVLLLERPKAPNVEGKAARQSAPIAPPVVMKRRLPMKSAEGTNVIPARLSVNNIVRYFSGEA